MKKNILAVMLLISFSRIDCSSPGKVHAKRVCIEVPEGLTGDKTVSVFVSRVSGGHCCNFFAHDEPVTVENAQIFSDRSVPASFPLVNGQRVVSFETASKEELSRAFCLEEGDAIKFPKSLLEKLNSPGGSGRGTVFQELLTAASGLHDFQAAFGGGPEDNFRVVVHDYGTQVEQLGSSRQQQAPPPADKAKAKRAREAFAAAMRRRMNKDSR